MRATAGDDYLKDLLHRKLNGGYVNEIEEMYLAEAYARYFVGRYKDLLEEMEFIQEDIDDAIADFNKIKEWYKETYLLVELSEEEIKGLTNEQIILLKQDREMAQESLRNKYEKLLNDAAIEINKSVEELNEVQDELYDMVNWDIKGYDID